MHGIATFDSSYRKGTRCQFGVLQAKETLDVLQDCCPIGKGDHAKSQTAC